MGDDVEIIIFERLLAAHRAVERTPMSVGWGLWTDDDSIAYDIEFAEKLAATIYPAKKKRNRKKKPPPVVVVPPRSNSITLLSPVSGSPVGHGSPMTNAMSAFYKNRRKV